MKDIAHIYDLTEEQLKDLYSLYSTLHGYKPTTFRKVLPEYITENIRSLSSEWVMLLGEEIQLSEKACDVCIEYGEELYFSEHDNDEIEQIGIDIETYSSVDLTKSGVYKYAESEDFTILLFAYSVNNSPVRVIDIASDEIIPDKIIKALTDGKVLKTAFNANFERVCLGAYLGKYLPPEQWDCTMIGCVRLGLPFSLAQCAEVMRLDNKKMKEGASLIRYFSCPCKPTKANGGRTRNLPAHDPDKWRMFVKYNKRDVEVEQEIRRRIAGRYPITNTERLAWYLDQRINDRGVKFDRILAEKASLLDDEYKEALMQELNKLTGLGNANSVMQLKLWLSKETGLNVASINKESVSDMIARTTSESARRVLAVRQELGKTSTAKYKSMLECACGDDRIRGLFQFYGAVRTGRFAGRLVQMQNLPQNHIPDLDNARSLVREGNMDDILLEYGNVPGVLSELIRTAFVAEQGRTFIVCDFSAIEARIIAWLAGEEWVLDVFRNNGDIYCATASQMFGVPVEKHGKNKELRAKGKIASLALGFGGGINALEKMGGTKLGLTQIEMKDIVAKWRSANPQIVKLWRHVELAVKSVLAGTCSTAKIRCNVTFSWAYGSLRIKLPSGRELCYPNMHINDNKCFEYEGLNQTTKKWERIETYGGKITENIVQSIARDCLIETMLRLDANGYKIVFHVHDETIIEAEPKQTLEDVKRIFSQPIPWAKGLPLRGDGYTTPYYLKD